MKKQDYFDNQGRDEAIDALISFFEDPNVGQRCFRTAGKHFSLYDDVVSYDRICREVTSHR